MTLRDIQHPICPNAVPEDDEVKIAQITILITHVDDRLVLTTFTGPENNPDYAPQVIKDDELGATYVRHPFFNVNIEPNKACDDCLNNPDANPHVP